MKLLEEFEDASTGNIVNGNLGLPSIVKSPTKEETETDEDDDVLENYSSKIDSDNKDNEDKDSENIQDITKEFM